MLKFRDKKGKIRYILMDDGSIVDDKSRKTVNEENTELFLVLLRALGYEEEESASDDDDKKNFKINGLIQDDSKIITR